MRIARKAVTFAIAAVFALSVSAGVIKTDIPGIGPETLSLATPDPTTAGSFDGTWMYVNRDARFALWIRTRNGVPQVRVQYQSLANPEAFESDWDGNATYYLAGSPVTFALKLGKGTADQISGTWRWDVTIDNSSRRETADIVLYRSGYGRSLVMDFQNYQKTITRNGRNSIMKAPMNWSWNKVSRREVLWDEIPF